MNRTINFANSEWYHCYNRGVDKRILYKSTADYARFQMLLYVANSLEPLRISDHVHTRKGPDAELIFTLHRSQPLVTLGAYALMPNHYHLLAQQLIEGGLSLFMKKVDTGYSMFFNKKYERTGTLFSSRFQAKHIDKDRYMKRIVNYIHANPLELIESGMKKGVVLSETNSLQFLKEYQYSSLFDYCQTAPRVTANILDTRGLLAIIEQKPTALGALKDIKDFGSWV